MSKKFSTEFLIAIHGEETVKELEQWLDAHQAELGGEGVLSYVKYQTIGTKIYGLEENK